MVMFVAGQTWIIIVLIFFSILVTVSEVILRFGILSARGSRSPPCGSSNAVSVSGAGALSMAQRLGVYSM
jgi:hypothetical protein